MELDARPDWIAALRHEAARGARYGRPTSVLLIEPRNGGSTTASEASAVRITEAIQAHGRESDRIVRTGPLSFRLLLPEADARAAAVVAARLTRATTSSGARSEPDLELRIEAVSAPGYGSIEDALNAAERRLTEPALEGGRDGGVMPAQPEAVSR